MMRLVPIGLLGAVAFTLFSFYPSAFARSFTAYNWAGYFATLGDYSSISGSWIIPSVPASSSTSAHGEWIGIGGFSGSDLIQTGTRAISVNGQIAYTAWYELIPAPAVNTPLSVAPGDSIAASIAETSPDTWQITLVNQTTGKSFTTSVTYSSSHSSAEWIEEMPRTTDGYLTLGAFSPITFTNINAASATRLVHATDLHTLSMIDSEGAALAAPSKVAQNSFTVSRSF